MAPKTPKPVNKDQHGADAHVKHKVRTGSKSLSEEKARKLPKGNRKKPVHESNVNEESVIPDNMSEICLSGDEADITAIGRNVETENRSIRFELIPAYRTSTPMLIKQFRLVKKNFCWV